MSDEPLFARPPRAVSLAGDPADEDAPEGQSLYQTSYCSRAVDGTGEAAVDRIIATAHRHNPLHGITGLLVFGSGVFFQWIEGPREPMQFLMDKIRADTRHERVVVLSESEEVRERLFPNWDMERVDADDIREVLQDALESTQDPRNAGSLTALLQQLDGEGLGGLDPA